MNGMNVVVLHLADLLLAGDPSDVKNDCHRSRPFLWRRSGSITGVIINQNPAPSKPVCFLGSSLPLPRRYPAFGFGARIMFDRH
jgi:hypothetical protein